jgi:hypothetical protein
MAMTPEERRERAWDLRLQRTYGITAVQYWAIYKLQHGLCALCHEPTKEVVRGLLHGWCNHRVLGRTTLVQARQMVHYLANPPAAQIVGDAKVPVRKRKPRKKRIPG